MMALFNIGYKAAVSAFEDLTMHEIIQVTVRVSGGQGVGVSGCRIALQPPDHWARNPAIGRNAAIQSLAARDRLSFGPLQIGRRTALHCTKLH